MSESVYYVGYYYDHFNHDQVVLIPESKSSDQNQMAKIAIQKMQQKHQTPTETTLNSTDYLDDLLTVGGNYVVLSSTDLSILSQ